MSTETVAAKAKLQPGRKIMEAMLAEVAMVVKRPSSQRQRRESIEDPDGRWKETIGYFQRMRAKYRIPLSNCKDSDEMCGFYEGSLGWKMFQRCIGVRGQSLTVKARASLRKTLSILFGTTASGRVIPPAFLGKERDFGKDTEKGRKLRDIRDTLVPGKGGATIKDLADVSSNEAGFFNGRTYADMWLSGSLERWIAKEEAPQDAGPDARVGIHIDDATSIHNGETQEEGKLLGEKRNMNASEYLSEKLKQVKVDLPGGYTSYRPQDQRFINFIVQWRYICFMESITGTADFRNEIDQVRPEVVIQAYLLTLEWLEARPELIVAAWLQSGLVTVADYEAEGYDDLVAQAKLVLEGKDAEVEGARQRERGLWERDDIMLITSLCDCEEERPRGRERFNLEWLDGAVTRKQAQEYQTEHRAHGPSPGDGTNRDAKSACKEFEAAIRKEQEQGRKRKAEEMEAKEELALQSAATDVVVKTVARLRICSKRPDPKCRSTCHDGWHDDNCPNNPRSKGIAAEALVRRAHSAGRAVREAWGPTEEANLFKAMGLQQPSPAPAPFHFSGVGPDILGGRMKSCPQAVHEQMLLQAAHSRIQITSLEQRSKCFLDKVPCHVPPSFQQALRWCYVHPKLPPPLGTKWWNNAGVWELALCGQPPGKGPARSRAGSQG